MFCGLNMIIISISGNTPMALAVHFDLTSFVHSFWPQLFHSVHACRYLVSDLLFNATVGVTTHAGMTIRNILAHISTANLLVNAYNNGH